MSESCNAWIKDPAYERWRWQIFAITWLTYAGFHLTRMSFAIAKVGSGPGVGIGLTPPQMAWVDGAFLVAYAAGQFVWGIAGDRFGTRKVVAPGMVGSVLAATAMGLSSGPLAFGVCFFLQGLCQASSWAPLAKNVSNWFSQRERGVVLGAWCTSYPAGKLLALGGMGLVGQRFGWRWAFFLPAAILLGIWPLFLLLQRNRPADVGLPTVEVYRHEPSPLVNAVDIPGEELEGSWRLIVRVVTHPMVMLLSGVYLCVKPVIYAVLFWGPRYLNDKLGAGMAEAGLFTAIFPLAGLLSVMGAGVVSDRLFERRRVPAAVLCLVALAALLLLLDRLPRSRPVLAVALFLLGVLAYTPDVLISGIAAVDFGTRKGASTAAGMVNGFGSIGAVLGGTVPGFLQGGWRWQGVFSLLVGAALVAALLLLPKWNALPAGARTGNGLIEAD